MSSPVVAIDILRSLGNASISGTYADLGLPFSYPVRLICITNNTDGDLIFSDDGINDKLFVPKMSFKLFDLTTNKQSNQPTFAIRAGTQISVKQSSAPTTGSVYVEAIHGLVG